MTQIQGTPPPRDRLDDNTVLQRRLMQDLERQWLDTWGQARQLQAQAGFQIAASNAEADAGVVTEAPGTASRQALGQAVANGEIRHGGDDAESPALIRGSEGGERLSQAAGASTSAAAHAATSKSSELSAQPAGSSLAQPRAPDGSQGIRPGSADSIHEATAVKSGAGSEGGVTAVVLGMRPQVNEGLHAEAMPINAMGGAALSSERAWNAVNSAGPEQALAATAATSTAAEPVRFALPAKGSTATPSSVGEGDAEASAPTRPRFSSTPTDAEPASHHLMLRELNEQEVLASMRDTQLGSLESQMAAQELARALMQAGYARVQVVVNGHQRKQGDAAADDRMATDSNSSAAEQPSRMTSNIQGTSHGN